ncbi:MAG: Gfo/Idh/MocA family oxidoreductase [Ardenticatenaceae bacterium]|nr:Gfo/Idh/MocA family oxidoreductase [Ardenticatenaceae bacterium]
MKRIGIVGAGAIGGWHAERWQKLPVAIAGFYDIRAEAAERAVARFGGQVYESVEALVADVDVVDVCTITTAHKEGVLAAAAGGTAVICEKPLARNVADCEEMIAACEAANVPLFVAQVVRFFPQFEKAKAVLDSGALGKPGVIRTVRAGSMPAWGERSWFHDFEQSGGVMMDLGIHDLDFVRWCFGEITRVFARGLSFAGENGRDHALITLRFANGAIGHIESSWAHPAGQFRTRLEIAGDEGLMEWDSLKDAPVQLALTGEDGSVNRSTASPLATENDPYYAELAHFLDCMENGTPCRVTPQDGLMAVKVSLAAIESMRTGMPVEIA